MQRLCTFLRDEWLLAILLAALPALILLHADPVAATLLGLPDLIHWDTLAALGALMVLSRGLEDSGYLFQAGRWLLERVHGERGLAAVLVLFSAALSAVITNDVALFIVVPLTLGLASVARLPTGRLVIFQALAVNAGSSASPVGNPQNLYLWQTADVGFLEFGLAMAPLGGALMLLLLVLVPIGFASGRIDLTECLPGPARRRGLLCLSLALYPVFLLCAELDASLVAAATVFALFFVCARSVLAGTDWVLLAVFALMFVDLGLLARVPAVTGAAAELGNAPGGMLTAGILLSQFLSNVPATIFLAEFTDDWRTLAWAVSIGGFGLAIGSMANLIALRLAREPGLWWAFHAWSVPVLAAGWLIAWLTIGG